MMSFLSANWRAYLAQVKGLFGLHDPLPAAKRDTTRSVRTPEQLGHRAPVLPAETLWSRANLCPQSLHLYS